MAHGERAPRRRETDELMVDLGSGVLEVQGAVAPPGDGGVGEVGGAQHG
jgi:hypothetical protein